ncbi:hypothetical protein FRC11_000629, partial [Ceratobasidium sp. 423]
MQTTRLHISGLTPAISASDLKQRFSTFGDVRDVDGVGKLDGVGRPRKFAYLTLETTQSKLARCMNLLSGSTWKGAKLRIGEAKPDYTARNKPTPTRSSSEIISRSSQTSSSQISSAGKKIITRNPGEGAQRHVSRNFEYCFEIQGMASNASKPPHPSNAHASSPPYSLFTHQTTNLQNETEEKAKQEKVRVDESEV